MIASLYISDNSSVKNDIRHSMELHFDPDDYNGIHTQTQLWELIKQFGDTTRNYFPGA